MPGTLRSKRLNICIYCGTTLSGKKSKEHVIPRWLLTHLNIGFEDITPSHMKPDGTVISERAHNLFNLLNGRVCIECNTGWMSALESAVKPLLIQLISGTRRVQELSTFERQLVSSWATKTAYVLHNASDFHEQVPIAHYHSQFELEGLPPDGVVCLARQHDEDSRFYWLQSSSWFGLTSNKAMLTRGVNKGYKICLQFGKLILLVAWWPLAGWQYLLEKGMHTPLWPLRGPVSWQLSANVKIPTPKRHPSSVEVFIFLLSLQVVGPDHISASR